MTRARMQKLYRRLMNTRPALLENVAPPTTRWKARTTSATLVPLSRDTVAQIALSDGHLRLLRDPPSHLSKISKAEMRMLATQPTPRETRESATCGSNGSWIEKSRDYGSTRSLPVQKLVHVNGNSRSSERLPHRTEHLRRPRMRVGRSKCKTAISWERIHCLNCNE